MFGIIDVRQNVALVVIVPRFKSSIRSLRKTLDRAEQK